MAREQANVVVAQSPVEGNERGEVWWEALGEMLTAFANDVPTYVCIGANGRLGSSTLKHVGSLAADEETPNGERLRRFFVGLNLWIRPKIVQSEPLLVARSQAIGSARRGAVMTQFATRVLFDGVRIRSLSAAAFFCDLALPTTVWSPICQTSWG